MSILVVHGPNLNLLGEREPSVYGTLTLAQLNAQIVEYGRARDCRIRTYQSNHEGRLLDALQRARHWAAGIVINPGAYGHTSYALRDCIAGIRVPTVEVHLSDVEAREPFRRISTIADVCIAKISGKGPQSYLEAIDLLLSSRANRTPVVIPSESHPRCHPERSAPPLSSRA
jgi:3-dehydroquinate dehydratase-2